MQPKEKVKGTRAQRLGESVMSGVSTAVGNENTDTTYTLATACNDLYKHLQVPIYMHCSPKRRVGVLTLPATVAARVICVHFKCSQEANERAQGITACCAACNTEV